jgi:hypothetical protein
MNVQPDRRMDKPEFLSWVQAREGRYELAGSRVVMMTGGSRGRSASCCRPWKSTQTSGSPRPRAPNPRPLRGNFSQ